MRLRLLATATAILFATPLGIDLAQAAPPLLNYQAYLTDDEGIPLDGPVNLEFAIYDSLAGGASLWSEAHPATMVEDGIFHAILGGGNPLPQDLFDRDALWLETRLAGTPLAPRRPLLSVPYALRAEVADVALSGGGGDDDWTINGSDIYRLNGKVGIGNAAPTERLHVTDGLFSRLRLDRTGGASVQTDASLSTGSVGTLSAHPFRLLSNNAVRMSIASDGLIGIGTTSPTQTLQVNGTTSRAIYGLQLGTGGTLIGVLGESNSITGVGVRGQANHATGAAIGVYGQSTGTGSTGVLGENISGSGVTYGLLGRAGSPDGFGIYADNTSATGKAAYLDGDAVTAGTHTIGTTPSLALSGASAAASDDFSLGSANDLTLSADRALLAESATSTEIDAGTTLLLTSSGGTTLSSSATTTISAGSYVRINANVGLGLAPGFQLHLSSNSAAKPTSNTWTIASDRRLKKNIEPLRGSLDSLLRLRGVTYQWRDPSTQGNMHGVYPGFIAQEVEPVFPDWIQEGANGFKTLTVIGFEALAVEALRELRQEKDREIDALEERLRRLEERLSRYEDSMPASIDRLGGQEARY